MALLGFVAGILYLLLIPESPKWIFMKQGPRSKEGIEKINYIARFNGSKHYVPEDAVVDLAGQMMLEH